MKDRELWMSKLKEMLEDYSEPVPVSGWERLEKELPLPVVEKRILYPYRKWAVAAAAAVLVAVSSVSIYFLSTPAADEVRRTAVPALASNPDVLPPAHEPAMQVAKVEPARTIHRVASHSAGVAERQGPEPPVVEETALIPADKQTGVSPEVKEENTSIAENNEQQEERAVVKPRKASGKDKLHLPVEKRKAPKGRWSVGASVGNAGGMSMSDDSGMGGMNGMPGQRLSLLSASPEGFIRIPDNQMVVFKEGVPYLMQTDEVVDVKHHQPVSFGLSVRKGLAKGFSIETGLTYTLLSSDVQTASSDGMLEQKLHYLGIPVRANWNFLEKDRFTLYVSGGGMIEKCVYGKRGNDKLTVDPLQLSVNGAVGAQFNATNHVGIYVEPGVSYFFDNGSDVPTIRKDTPCNFNIQAGIRFTY